jgi:hypothetical protein
MYEAISGVAALKRAGCLGADLRIGRSGFDGGLVLSPGEVLARREKERRSRRSWTKETDWDEVW